MKINLSNDDLKIIDSAITWTLFTPFTRSDPPEFSDHEQHRLQAIFDSICHYRHEVGICEASISEIGLIIQDSFLTSNSNEVQHIIMCVESFHNEIGHSPTEVMVVADAPISQLESLIERLSKLKNTGDES